MDVPKVLKSPLKRSEKINTSILQDDNDDEFNYEQFTNAGKYKPHSTEGDATVINMFSGKSSASGVRNGKNMDVVKAALHDEKYTMHNKQREYANISTYNNHLWDIQ